MGDRVGFRYPSEAVFRKPYSCRWKSCFWEGAGADPSQRIGTRLGGVVSSRDCRLVGCTNVHNTVKPVYESANRLQVPRFSRSPVYFSGKFSPCLLPPLDRTNITQRIGWFSRTKKHVLTWSTEEDTTT